MQPSPAGAGPSAPPDRFRHARTAVAIAAFLAAAVLLFARLGHYALWDDEALDALSAKAIGQTGDTGAVVGHNIVAYRGGLLLRNMRLEGQPPLPAYLAAPFLRLLGPSSFAVRLPFALCGLACAGLMLCWSRRAAPSLQTHLLFALALLGNVSFFLYCRQCHYYALSTLLSVAIVYHYLRKPLTNCRVACIALLSMALMASNSLQYAALYGCLLADYIVWKRRECPLGRAQWPLLLLPQLAAGAVLAAWWNPFHTGFGNYPGQDTLRDRLVLFLWNWRAMDRCEFMAGLLILAAPLLAAAPRKTLLRRAVAALFVYVTVVTILSPQIVAETSVADVRDLVPLIPLCLAIEVMALDLLTARARWAAIPLALAAFGTNLLCGGPLLPWGLQSTIGRFAGELISPPGDPYSVAADWINRNIPANSTVWVLPDYMVYPLMFHAPGPVYAWQLRQGSSFPGLDPIHFAGVVPPDYAIAFGPVKTPMLALLDKLPGAKYELAATLDHYWRDMHRPELFWRTFVPIENFDTSTDAIYVFHRISAPP